MLSPIQHTQGHMLTHPHKQPPSGACFYTLTPSHPVLPFTITHAYSYNHPQQPHSFTFLLTATASYSHSFTLTTSQPTDFHSVLLSPLSHTVTHSYVPPLPHKLAILHTQDGATFILSATDTIHSHTPSHTLSQNVPVHTQSHLVLLTPSHM